MRHCHYIAEAKARYLVAGKHVELAKLCYQLYKSGTDSADHIIEEKLLRSPHILNHAAEHPQGKHVEEQMRESGMHEHISEELIYLEIARKEEVKSKHAVQVDALTAEHPCGGEHKHIDNQQILCNSRYSEHTQNNFSSIINVGKNTKNICYIA